MSKQRNWFGVNRESATYRNVFRATVAAVKGIDATTDVVMDGLEATSHVLADTTMAVADGIVAPAENTPAAVPTAA